MAEVKHGSVTVVVPDHLAPPERAGKLSVEEVRRLPKARLGLGLACAQASDSIVKAGDRFVLPAGVTAESLESAGSKAEEIDSVINDLEVALDTLKQANLLFDADAWEQLRRVNDQLKAQAKHDPSLEAVFAPLLTYFEAKGVHRQ